MPAPISAKTYQGSSPPQSSSPAVSEYPQNQKDNDKLLFDFAEKRYNYELQRIKDLDSKVGNLIGYVGIVTLEGLQH